MKTMGKFFWGVTLMVLATLLPGPVCAGPYTDDLTHCIAESTTPEEQLEFAKWAFSTLSIYTSTPPSQPSVSPEQINAANERTADLFMRLVTDSCKEKAEKAIQFEGEFLLQSSLSLLEQVAGPEILKKLDVAALMALIDKYIDVDKLISSLKLN